MQSAATEQAPTWLTFLILEPCLGSEGQVCFRGLACLLQV